MLIEEYAISRLMLCWRRAANAPHPIDRIETTTTICCHCANKGLKGPISTETVSEMAAILGAAANSAVTGVGAPS